MFGFTLVVTLYGYFILFMRNSMVVFVLLMSKLKIIFAMFMRNISDN